MDRTQNPKREELSMRGQVHFQSRTLLAALVGVSVAIAGGCVSYTNVSGPQSPPSFRSPNHYAAVDVTGVALDWVLARHGPDDGSGYVVNLPAGMSQENAMKIFADLPSGAVWPGSADQDSAGMFHVGRVWIRASEAKVDVVYPFAKVDGSMGQRGVTVWLQGGVRDWRVIRGQYWAPGTVSIPAVSVPLAPEEKAEVQSDEPVVDMHDETPVAAEPVIEPVVEPEQIDEVEAEVEEKAEEVVEEVPGVEDDGSSTVWREVPAGEE